MLKSWMIFLALAVGSLASAETKKDDPSLDLKFDGPMTIKAGSEEVKFTEPFIKSPDGKNGLGIGSTQNIPRIPASFFVGEKGTILFTFMNQPVKPQNALLNRSILVLRGEARERVTFGMPGGSKSLQFTFKNFTDPKTFETTTPIEFNRWYQVVCTWDGSTVKLFLDGVLQTEFQQPYVPKFPENSTFLYMGPYVDGYTNPEPWNEDSCLIREVKIYKRALSPEEIMSAAGVQAVDASKAFKTFLTVPKVTVAPKINGTLDDDSWQRASSLITLIDGQKPEESFSYKDNNPKFCHDGKVLYVGFSSQFPATYKLLKGEERRDKEPEVWADESFEFYLNVAGKIFRFGGNAAGGYCESLDTDVSFNGQWQYKTTVGTQIDNTTIWQGEIAIPFETLGVAKPDGSEITINFGRTWRGLERIGITALTGIEQYDKKDLFVTLKISDSDLAFQEVSVSNPNFGTMAQKTRAFSGKDANLEYSVKLLSSGGFVPERFLLKKTINLKGDSVEVIDNQSSIESTSYDRLLFQVKDTTKSELLMQQVVPFKVVENYLEVIPAFSSAKVYLKPRYTLVKNKTNGNPVKVEIVSPSDKTIFTTTISSNDEFSAPFARDNEVGAYRAVVYSVMDGKKTTFTSNTFNYHGVGPWEKKIENERVLPPFEPLSVTGKDGSFDIGMWGRVYQYKNSLLPMSITASRSIKPWTKEQVVTASTLLIDGKEVNSPLKVTKSVPCRVELTGEIQSKSYDLKQNSWIEYDGVLWNSISIKAKENLSGIQLKMIIPESMAKFYHATSAGFGAGGRRTDAIDKDIALTFWPVVWVGGYEQGISWFAESNSSWKTADTTPIRIIKNKGQTLLEVQFADKLDKGQDIKIEFGLVATPVKPLPKNYPFTMFGDNFSTYINRKPPRAPIMAVALLPEALGEGFFDLPLDGPHPNAEMKRALEGKAICEKNNVIFIPYQGAVNLDEGYPVVKDNLLEWQTGPANHFTYQEPRTGKTGVIYNICPASAGGDYFVYRFKEMVEKMKLKGIYFDFGVAVPCSNRYHGCDGGYTLLAKREFFKKIAHVLADANNGEYTIVIHNSESVQVPVSTFATHFLNGEGLRQASSSVFHFGKDLLDHYQIPDFASEHSSLPWGITSSVYVPTDPLAPQFGGEDEPGKQTPQELYKFRMTKAAMAGALIHNTIPSSARMHYGWFDKVLRFYDDFKISQAEFLPYWRNGVYVHVVQGKDIYVSYYRHAEKKELLVVISHVSKEHLDQDVVVEFNPAKLGFSKLTSAAELLTGPDPEYQSLYTDVPDTTYYADASRWRIPVKLGDFGVEFQGLENNRIKLKLKYHSVAIVKISAE
jgi:hypothetical protein